MKVALHSNGRLELHLTSETLVEAAYLKTMRDAAEKGTAVHLDQSTKPTVEDGPVAIVVSMEV